MSKLSISVLLLSSLTLTGCVSLASSKVGEDFQEEVDGRFVNALDNPPSITLEDGVPVDQGQKYGAGYSKEIGQFYAGKSVKAGITGVRYQSHFKAIAKGTTLAFDKKNRNVWDRIENHVVVVDSLIKADAGLLDIARLKDDVKAEDFDISKARLSFDGNLVEEATGYSFESLALEVKDERFTKTVLDNFVPAGVMVNVGDLEKIFAPDVKHEEHLYGVYSKTDDQITAFYSSAVPMTTADQLKSITASKTYNNLEFRGITKGNIDGNNLARTKLYGDGTSTINFTTGDYDTKLNVKTKSGADFGKITFKGTDAAIKTNLAENLDATLETTAGTQVSGRAEITAYGKNAEKVMGVTDFTHGDFALVGAFGPKPKYEKLDIKK